MIYRFEHFELDVAKRELRANGAALPIEPQVFALLCLLIENRDRVVEKQEIIDRVWNGRFISDSAVASRIKSARQALTDDGATQRLIKTAHGVGFRFVGNIADKSAPSVEPRVEVLRAEAPAAQPAFAGDRARPSIAVLPFRLIGVAGPYAAITEALPGDLIAELSRLRWLFVIARASSFRFRGEAEDIDRVRTDLNARYCLTGAVEIYGAKMILRVELSDTHDKGVVWTERFDADLEAVHDVREEITSAVIAALELQIPLNEARWARLKSPGLLDAWSAYHLGLQHMYRFNEADNAIATNLFERAIALDPEFARAYAGLSFTHFQSAFVGYADASQSKERARIFAEQCLERDPVDPFGNLTMGRAFWLDGDLEGSLPWLDRAITLNPNYAQGKYSRAWTESMLGADKEARVNTDMAMSLSPLDPLRYGMLGVRAFSCFWAKNNAEAALWADQAALAPGAHVLIHMIAVAAHGMNGDDARARYWADKVRARAPGISQAEFFRSFPFRDPALRKTLGGALAQYGF